MRTEELSFREPVTVEKIGFRSGTLKLLVAHNGDACRRLPAAFAPVPTRLPGLLMTLAHPFPETDAFASGDSSPHRIEAHGEDVARSTR